MMRTVCACACALFLPVVVSRADVALPAVFSDDMVLQREMKTPVWGTAEPGETITIKLGPYTATAKADDTGAWKTTLDDMKAGGPFEMTVAGKNSLAFKNVMVGDVWLATGHSNMSLNSHRLSAEDSGIRYHYIGRRQPWHAAGPKDPGYSFPYWFGRKLSKDLGVTMGFLCAMRGSNMADSWTNPAEFDFITPYGLKGALKVLDGRADVSKRLIEAWRTRWGQGDFPFFYGPWVPCFTRSLDEEPDPVFGQRLLTVWHHSVFCNESLIPLLDVPNTFAIDAFDSVRAEDYLGAHWKNKRAEGERLAWAAEAVLYGMKHEPLGPVYDSMAVEGARVRIKFTHVGGGLMARSYHRPQTSLGVALQDFRIAGEDGRWVMPTEDEDWEVADNDGKTVFVYRETLPNPKAIRYACAPYPLKTGFAIEPMKDALKTLRRKKPGDFQVRPVDPEVLKKLADPNYTINGIRVTYDPAAENGDAVMKEHAQEPLRGFVICGEDERWYRAEAKIEGDTVVVWSDRIPKPVAVRYAWSSYALGNLYNKEGLPAYRFRTDPKKNLLPQKFFGLRPAPIFQDYMVLQRGMPASVFGVAEPGSKVSVKCGKYAAETVADTNGRWLAKIGPMEVGLPQTLVITDSFDTFTFRDVAVGDVWICLGDSVLWKVNDPGRKEAADAHPDLRLCSMHGESQSALVSFAVWTPDKRDYRGYDTGPQFDIKEQTRRGFSGPAYWFGRRLQDSRNVPVGVIVSAPNRASLASWLPAEMFQSEPSLQPFLKQSPRGEYGKSVSRWLDSLSPMTAQGVIWADQDGPEAVAPMLPELAKYLRLRWAAAGQPKLPIVFIQTGTVARKEREAAQASIPDSALVDAGETGKDEEFFRALAARIAQAAEKLGTQR